jgi:hypothetical protein
MIFGPVFFCLVSTTVGYIMGKEICTDEFKPKMIRYKKELVELINFIHYKGLDEEYKNYIRN